MRPGLLLAAALALSSPATGQPAYRLEPLSDGPLAAPLSAAAAASSSSSAAAAAAGGVVDLAADDDHAEAAAASVHVRNVEAAGEHARENYVPCSILFGTWRDKLWGFKDATAPRFQGVAAYQLGRYVCCCCCCWLLLLGVLRPLPYTLLLLRQLPLLPLTN